MILLFLLSTYYWIAPDGFISAILVNPVKNHSGFTCLPVWQVPEEVQKDVARWYYDGKEFVLKPPMKISFAKDSINIEQTNIKSITEITVYEKVSQASITSPKQAVYDKTATGKVNTKQSWTVGNITVINKLAYPMRVDIEVSK